MKHKITFDKPAYEWEEGFPIGNGRMGAMILGGIEKEIIYLNEDTLWSGKPEKEINRNLEKELSVVRDLLENKKYKQASTYVDQNMLGDYSETYLPFATLEIDFRRKNKVDRYKRELDLKKGIVTIEESIDDNQLKRKSYVSKEDEIIIYQISSNKKNLNVGIKLFSQIKSVSHVSENTIEIFGNSPIHQDPIYALTKNPTIYDDKNPGMAFHGLTKVLSDGEIKNEDGNIKVENGSNLILWISLSTNFQKFSVNPKDSKIDPKLKNEKNIKIAMEKGLRKIEDTHTNDFSQLYNRVDINLGDEKIEKLFHMGRYLLISSSRKGTQPANLQGIWNGKLIPPWSSNYTLNINTQMNYWLAEVCNLGDCHEPLFDYIENLSLTGKKVARQFGCKGFAVNHNGDIWCHADQVQGKSTYAFWPMSGVWLSNHMFEHYLFNMDLEFLEKRAFPILKSAGEFVLDYLILNKNGEFVTSPSTSPENSFLYGFKECYVSEGSTVDISLISQLFNNIIVSYELLKMEEDCFLKEVLDKSKKLRSLKVGKKGQLLEWEEDFKEIAIGHRHLSHLVGLYPLNVLEEQWNKAVASSMKRRSKGGKGWTGWSMAWRVCLEARLGLGEDAYKDINNLLNTCSYENFLGKHKLSPLPFSKKGVFQIDSNFGITAGICEMLLQSHKDYIEFCPAIPKAWENGFVKGLKARKNIICDIFWENGLVNKIALYSIINQNIKIKVNKDNKLIDINLKEKEKIEFTF